MVVKILDHVANGATGESGAVIFELIKPRIGTSERITISFEGIESVPSSFVNAAFINLLDHFTFEQIRSSLHFVRTTKQINDMIKNRFAFERQRKTVTGNRE